MTPLEEAAARILTYFGYRFDGQVRNEADRIRHRYAKGCRRCTVGIHTTCFYNSVKPKRMLIIRTVDLPRIQREAEDGNIGKSESASLRSTG